MSEELKRRVWNLMMVERDMNDSGINGPSAYDIRLVLDIVSPNWRGCVDSTEIRVNQFHDPEDTTKTIEEMERVIGNLNFLAAHSPPKQKTYHEGQRDGWKDALTYLRRYFLQPQSSLMTRKERKALDEIIDGQIEEQRMKK